MSRTILLCCCLLLQSCVVTGGKGGYSGGDNLFGAMDKIQTSSGHPNAREAFIPTNNELKHIEGDKKVVRLERNYFLLMTYFDTKNDIIIQKTNQDCWAACSIMVLKHEKVQFPSDVVDKIRDELVNAKEARDEMSVYMRLVNSHKKATYSKPVTGSMLIDSLANNHPLLVGFEYEGLSQGHIQLVIGCYYSYIKPTFADELVDRKVNMAIDRVVFIDPADGKQKEMSGDEFVKSANFGISFTPKISQVGFIGFE